MNVILKSTVPFVSLALVLACSGPEPATEKTAATQPVSPVIQPPTAEEAATLIASSPELSDFEFTFASFSLPMMGATANDRTKQPAEDLAAAGWIALDGAGNVTLPAKSASDQRFLVRPNGFVDIVPLAKKELVEVSGIEVVGNEIVATFTWRWIPNEIGESFTTGSMYDRFHSDQDARATLRQGGDAWFVFLIERADPPVAQE